MKLARYLSNALRGNPRALQAHADAMSANPGIRSGLAALKSRQATLSSGGDEAPIFLFSSGWRAGSTFLQRLIMSDPGVLVWGEPYDECGLVQGLAETAKAFREGWPMNEYFLDDVPLDELPESWVANLFPSVADWRAGHRALFETLFAEPARRAGAQRWGIKEVRLSADHAHYLKWLYPGARFLFLTRNPLEAYSSYYRHGRRWYDVFPDKPVFTAQAFGAHWRKLAESFLRDADDLGALLVRYEDLAHQPEVLDRIEAYLDIQIDRTLIDRKIGSSERLGKKPRVNRLEKALLLRAVGSSAKQLGYGL